MNKMATKSFRTTGLPNAQQYREAENATAKMSANYRALASSTGLFEVSQAKVKSSTQEMTRALQKNKVGLLDMIKNRKVLNAVYEEQIRLQRMTVTGFRTDQRGNMLADITVPKALPSELDSISKKIGFFRTTLTSASTQMVNWGKNMQWAGRQLMVGFTLPVAAAAAGMGVLAYQANQNLTRISKVYDTTQHANMNVTQQMASNTLELANVQKKAMNVAQQAAADYGASMNDTLDTAAQLAATGLKGSELMSSTTQVMRIATLGEMDYQTALDATITMQSVFGDSAKKLGDDFNYMNAVENATSLQLSDFAAAIPIAAAPIKEMGGDIKTLGTLLVAMRSHGIQAVQGANAIKSAVARIFNPSVKVQDSFKALTGISIEQVRLDAHDKIIPIFQELSKLTDKIPQDQKMGLFSQLFGTYQRTRLMAIMSSMKDLGDVSTQTGRAMEIAGQSASKNLAIAENEIRMQAESASGRFKRAIETLKVELARAGEPFLEFGAEVVGVLAKMITAFNKLPHSVKIGVAGLMVAVALIGPMAMLAGLFMNMVGTIGRMIGGLLGLATRFDLVNKDQKIAALLADATTSALDKQAMATAGLTEQMTALAASIDMATKAQMGMSGTSRPLPARGPDGRFIAAPTQPRGPDGRFIKVPGEVMPDEKSSTAMRSMAISGGIFAAAMGASMISSSKLVDNAAQLLMMMALFAPMMTGVVGLTKEWGAAIRTNIYLGMIAAKDAIFKAATAMTMLNMGNLRASAVGFGRTLLAAATSAGGIGVALGIAAFAAYKLWQNSKNSAKEMDSIYKDANALSNIVGYTQVDNSEITKTGATTVGSASKADEFARAYGGVVDKIKAANTEQGKFNAAMVQGMKVINTGGTADQAREAIKIALTAATNEAEASKIMLHFKAQLDFENPTTLANNYGVAVQQAMDDAFGHLDSKSWWEQHDPIGTLKQTVTAGLWGDSSATDTRASKAALEAGKAAADSYVDGFNSVGTNDNLQAAMTRQLQTQLDRFRTAIHDALARGDTDTATQIVGLRQNFIEQIFSDKGVKNAGSLAKNAEAAKSAVWIMAQTSGKLNDSTEKQVLLWKQAHGGLSDLERGMLGILEGQARSDGALQGDFKGWQNVGQAAQDAYFYVADYAGGIQKANLDLKAMQGVWDSFATGGGAGTSLQGAYQNTMQAISGMITDQFQANETAAMNSLQQQGEARLKALDNERDARLAQYDKQEKQLEAQQQRAQDQFDAHWQHRIDTVTKSYDDRIAAVQKEMDTEQAQEEQRQKIFDAQMARVQQLADMANRNIDFNVALNSGNLDQAAQIRNDANAAQQTNAMQSASDAAATAAENASKQLQKQIDRLNKQKDTQLANLKKTEDAEKKALLAEQQRLKDSLASQRDHYEKLMAIRRDAAQADIQQNQDAEQRIWDMRKQGLDRALAAFMSYIPTSRAALDEWIKQNGQRYDEFGKVLQQHGKDWAGIISSSLTDNIRNAAQGLRSDIDWAGIAKDAATKMAWGAFHMTLPEFQKWAGIDAQNGATGTGPTGDNPGRHMGEGIPSRHEGGPIGGKNSRDARTGFPGNSALYPQEKLIRAHKDEYMIDGRTHKALGTDYFDGLKESVRKGRGAKDTGGAGGAMGLAGILGVGMAKFVNGMMQNTIMAKAQSTLGALGNATPGQYGDSGMIFDREQLGNAEIIASVGNSLGATRRDITVALMTAIVESGLRNVHYGDRDSLGLFQQRAPWGTAAQRLNPRESARMFFEGGHTGERGLFSFTDRDQMSMGQEAQAVQVSAFPERYAAMQDEAMAILAAMTQGAAGQGYNGSTGRGVGNGLYRPVRGGYLSQGLHDQDTGFPAVDIGVPIGTPVYAGAGGRVIVSKDLRGYESRIAHQNGYYSYGKYMEVQTPHNGTQLYAHLAERGYNVGALVQGGQQIGVSGLTGHTYGPHLHFGSQGTSPYAFLEKGGTINWDNTPALLHANEKVLSEPLSNSLVQGIKNMETGNYQGGDIKIEQTIVAAEGMDVEALANKAATKAVQAIKREKSLTGTRRVVGAN